MRARSVVTVVAAAVLALTSCGADDIPDQYDPVPESAWPDLAGVQVVSSSGYPGNECCESHAAVREIHLDVESTADFDAASDVVVQELRESGWTDYDCVHVVCMQHGDYRVELWHSHGHDQRMGTDVVIRLTRDANVGG